jgi:NADPH-dependent 2,4-dienoyl-CoA reductase/sulfur reductase-like enzyme
MRIAIIGAGHAGVEAALSARKAGAEAVLFSAEPVLPYFRPRLVSLAFGHVELDAIHMHPAAWYEAQGIQLRLNSPVAAFDPATRRITVGNAAETFDAVVLACGAMPVRPPLPAAPAGLPILTLWSAADADAIRSHVKPGRRLTILGGGILGIEAALNARDAGLRVTVIERQDRLMPLQFAPEGSAVLHQLLTGLGIAVRTGVATEGADLDADFVLLSIGSRPNLSLATAAGLQTGRGTRVDACLQTATPRVFGAGDTVELPCPFRPSAREAAAQGRAAGANAAAAAAGLPLQPYSPTPLPLLFKSGPVDLASEGTAWEPDCLIKRIEDGLESGQYRALITRNGVLAGVQAIGTRKEFDGWCKRIGEAV